VDGDVTGELAAGLEAYSDRDLPRAVDLLERARVTTELELLRQVYLGNALAMNGDYETAARVLRKLAGRDMPDPWGSVSRWTLYVSLKESGAEEAADSLLPQLAREPGSVGERAREILRSRDQ
jgi:Flp pilus assembly protein TadD